MKLGTRLKRVIKADPDTLRVTLEFTDGFRSGTQLT